MDSSLTRLHLTALEFSWLALRLIGTPKKKNRSYLWHPNVAFFCCFAKAILFQANGDNYCVLLRIGFWWNFWRPASIKDSAPKSTTFSSAYMHSLPTNIVHRLTLLKVNANSNSYLMLSVGAWSYSLLKWLCVNSLATRDNDFLNGDTLHVCCHFQQIDT